jgi:hypothetical protein
MTTIYILGGYGATGRLLVKHLLAQTKVNLIVAARNLDKAQALTDELGSSRVTAKQVDAADHSALRDSLRGADLCLVAAPTTRHTRTVIRACLDAGVDYLDVQLSASKLAALRSARAEIERAGRCFVTEAGFHPGLPSAMVRFAAGRLDVLESALTAGYLNMADLPYTEAVDELMEAFKDYQAQVFKDGAWTKPSAWDMRKFDFGPDVGQRMCYSMYFEEMRALPELYPSLKETGFYISGVNWLADLLVTPIVMMGLKLAPQRGLRPLGKLMWWAMGQTRPPYLVALKVEAKGQLNGQPARVSARLAHPDGYELTAIPVVAFLLQYLEGSARCTGLHMMGQLADPVRLFDDMQRMGVEIRTGVE